MNIDESILTSDALKLFVSEYEDKSFLRSSVIVNLVSQKVLVACSGGKDSVALAIICRAHDIDFALAYIEHGISPATADCELIVKELAARCDVPFFTAHLNMNENTGVQSNIEATARSLRYNALENIRSTHRYDVIATAHHEDDVAETFLINLVRGAGSGIASLSEKRDNLVRPLLHWRKSELAELVDQVGIECFSDPANSDSRFVRNRMRSEVLPLLNDIAQRDVTPLIARTARHMHSDNTYLEQTASSLWPAGEPSTRSLNKLDPVMKVHALRAWITGYPPSADEMDRILDVVEHRITSTQISGYRTIWRTGAMLYQDVTPTHMSQA